MNGVSFGSLTGSSGVSSASLGNFEEKREKQDLQDLTGVAGMNANLMQDSSMHGDKLDLNI